MEARNIVGTVLQAGTEMVSAHALGMACKAIEGLLPAEIKTPVKVVYEIGMGIASVAVSISAGEFVRTVSDGVFDFVDLCRSARVFE